MKRKTLTLVTLTLCLFLVWPFMALAGQNLTFPYFQTFDSNGDPLSGGLVYTYTAGTNTARATYPTAADASAGTNANTNPVVLDSDGKASIWLSGTYKIVLKTSAGVTVWTKDLLQGQGASILSFRLLSDYASLAAAVTDIGGTETTLWLDTDDTMGADVTVPATLALIGIKGHTITTTGYTLTINGPFEAGLYQVFSGTGAVSFGSGAVKEVTPQMWGAVADGVTDDTTAIQAAINAIVSAPRGTVLIPPGTYATTSELFFGSASVTVRNINIMGYGATISSTSTGNILRVGDSGGYGTMYSGIYGLRLLSETAAVGLLITGQYVYGSRFKDVTVEGKATSDANSTGILLFPTGTGNYMNLFEHCRVTKWDIGISLGRDFTAGTSIADVNAPNANRFQDIYMTNLDTYGLYIDNTVGTTYSGDFEGCPDATTDIVITNTANNNTIQPRIESGATNGITIASGCLNNLIIGQLIGATYTDNNTVAQNSFIGGGGVVAGHATMSSEYGYLTYLRNHAVGYPLVIAHNVQQQTYFSTVTKVQSIDVDAGSTDTHIDHVLDNTVANTTEQPINCGEIKAYAEIISVQLRCYTTVAGSGSAVMSIDVGITSGGAELLAAADIDTANDISTTATGNSPKLGAVKTTRALWVNFTPTANWDTLTAGKWVVMVTYIDYGRIKITRIGS